MVLHQPRGEGPRRAVGGAYCFGGAAVSLGFETCFSFLISSFKMGCSQVLGRKPLMGSVAEFIDCNHTTEGALEWCRMTEPVAQATSCARRAHAKGWHYHY